MRWDSIPRVRVERVSKVCPRDHPCDEEEVYKRKLYHRQELCGVVVVRSGHMVKDLV